jgi:hypothetical protein
LKKCAECRSKEARLISPEPILRAKVAKRTFKCKAKKTFKSQELDKIIEQKSETAAVTIEQTIQKPMIEKTNCPFFIPLFSEAVNGELIEPVADTSAKSIVAAECHNSRWPIDYDSNDTWYEEDSEESDYDVEHEKQQLARLLPRFLYDMEKQS